MFNIYKWNRKFPSSGGEHPPSPYFQLCQNITINVYDHVPEFIELVTYLLNKACKTVYRKTVYRKTVYSLITSAS